MRRRQRRRQKRLIIARVVLRERGCKVERTTRWEGMDIYGGKRYLIALDTVVGAVVARIAHAVEAVVAVVI